MERNIYPIKNIYQEKYFHKIRDDIIVFQLVIPFSINDNKKFKKIYKNIYPQNNDDLNIYSICYIDKIQIMITKHTYPFDIGLNIPGDPFQKYAHFSENHGQMFSFISSRNNNNEMGKMITLHHRNFKEDDNFRLWGGIHPKNMEQNIVNIPQLKKLGCRNNRNMTDKKDDQEKKEEYLLPFWHIIIQYLKVTQGEDFTNDFACLFDREKRNIPVLYKIPRIILHQTKQELERIYQFFDQIDLTTSKMEFIPLNQKEQKNIKEDENNNCFCLNGFIFYDIIPLEYKESIYDDI